MYSLSLPIIARMHLQTRKGRSLIVEQSFGIYCTCSVEITCMETLFDLVLLLFMSHDCFLLKRVGQQEMNDGMIEVLGFWASTFVS